MWDIDSIINFITSTGSLNLLAEGPTGTALMVHHDVLVFLPYALLPRLVLPSPAPLANPNIELDDIACDYLLCWLSRSTIHRLQDIRSLRMSVTFLVVSAID